MSWKAAGGIAGIVGLVALSFGGSGCRPKPTGDAPPAPSAVASTTLTVADAGVVGDAAAAAVDPTFAAVAQSPERPRFWPLADGRLLLSAGPLLYEAKADGTLSLVAPLDAFAAVLPESEALAGYDGANVNEVEFAASDKEGVVAQWFDRTFRVTAEKIVRADGAQLRDPVTWRGRVVGATAVGQLGWLTGSDPLPAPPGTTPVLTTDGAGALAVISRFDSSSSLHVSAPGAAPVKVPIPGRSDQSCAFVRAFDGGLYLRCVASSGSSKGHLLRHVDGAWKPAFADAPDGARAIAKDGSLWVGDHGIIRRCPVSGACTAVPHETFSTTAVPGYAFGSESVLVDDVYRSYHSFWLRDDKRDASPVVEEIVPRGANDVWAIVLSGSHFVVLHTGTATTSMTHVPSAADARVLVRNVKPPTPWVGHCDQIFVRVGPAREGEALGKRQGEVKKIVDAARTEDGRSVDWAIVRGRLHDRDSAGVLVWRNDVETPQAQLEAAATQLIDKLAANPVDRPSAYCTAPVLDAILAKPGPDY